VRLSRPMFALLVSAATVASASAPKAGCKDQPDASALSTRIDHSAKFYHDRYGFMGVVAIQRAHHQVYEAGYGYANMESHTAFDGNTRFPIGSLSKQFTAAAILLLQQDGKLKTIDSISRYYQNAPSAWSGITLRNLLTQTSGIEDFDFGLIHEGNLHTPAEALKMILDKPLTFAPGTKYEYANVNYVLLGLVAERVSGEPYCEFLHDRIFRPLQLKQTGCNWNAHSVEHRAYGYAPSANGPVAFEDDDLSAIAGAGSLYSTADDLIRWTEALFENKLLSKASLAEMTTPFLNGYGYGFDIGGEGAELDISHTGVVDGFFSCLDYIAATRTTVVVLSNLVKQGNLSTPGTLALDTELIRLGMNDDPILPSDGRQAKVPAEILRTYAGHYRSEDAEHPTDMILTFQNGRLFMQNIGGTPAPMNAESATRFYLPNQEAEAVFDSDTAGRLEFTNYDPIWGLVFNRVAEEKGSSVTRHR
jgi:CubicO group peptidase (beta-lactamase class C family)